jgi:hypothetical protein
MNVQVSVYLNLWYIDCDMQPIIQVEVRRNLFSSWFQMKLDLLYGCRLFKYQNDFRILDECIKILDINIRLKVRSSLSTLVPTIHKYKDLGVLSFHSFVSHQG